MRNTVTGDHSINEYDSIADIRRDVMENHTNAPVIEGMAQRSEWFGGIGSHDELFELARTGWGEKVAGTLQVAEETLESVTREYSMPAFQSYYDVTGSDVDVARYLSGEPENMISFQLVDTPGAGRVISLAANLAVSHRVTTQAMIARGQAIVALAYALESTGLRTELYADVQVNSSDDSDHTTRTVVKLKDAEDSLDPAMVMFAYAHPAFFRALCLSSFHSHPERFHEPMGIGDDYGRVRDTMGGEVFPEGCIRIPSLLNKHGRDSETDAKGFVIEHLTELGLIQDSDL